MKQSEEHIRKRIEARKRNGTYKMTEEHRKKLFTEERNKKISKTLTGRKLSKRHIKSIVDSHKGKHLQENHPNWISRETRICECGCGQTFECKANSNKRFVLGHNKRRVLRITKICKQCGKSFKCTQKEKKVFCNKKCADTFLKDKTYEQILGVNKAKEVKEKQSKAREGYIPHNKDKSYEETYNFEKVKEIKRNLRIARINQIELNYGKGKYQPNYNKKACEFFKSYDEKENTTGQYAMYGNGEYYIRELGYSPDYINFDIKLIMEYDEPSHYNKDGSLKQKDVERQKEIQEHFPDFKFERIKQER